jgi:hypothetical protein
MQFTRFLLLFLPPEQLRLFLYRGHGKESDGRRRSGLPSFSLVVIAWNVGNRTRKCPTQTYSLYQLLFINTIRRKTTLIATIPMVFCQDVFSLLRELQNETRSIFNPAKGVAQSYIDWTAGRLKLIYTHHAVPMPFLCNAVPIRV